MTILFYHELNRQRRYAIKLMGSDSESKFQSVSKFDILPQDVPNVAKRMIEEQKMLKWHDTSIQISSKAYKDKDNSISRLDMEFNYIDVNGGSIESFLDMLDICIKNDTDSATRNPEI